MPPSHSVSVAHVIAQTLIALAVVASVTVLGIQGTLDASAVSATLGAVIGIAGGVGAVRVGAGIVTNGGPTH